jgi:hypothetical protein
MTSVSRTFTLSVVAAPDPTVPAWVTATPLYQWTAVPTSNTANSQIPSPVPAGNSGTSSVVAAWGAAAVSASGDAYLWGGGHTDYAGNEVYRLRLNQSSPVWERISAPYTPTPQNVAYYASGHPSARHTYSSLWVSQNRLVSLGGGYSYGTPSGPTGYIDSLDLSVAATPSSPKIWTQLSANGGNWAACGDHTTGMIYGAQAFSYTTQFISISVANVVTILGTGRTSVEFSGAAYDSGRQRIYRIGGYGGTQPVEYWQIGGGSVDPSLTGSAAGAFDSAGSYTGVDYDSVNGWILYKDTSASTVYRLNCATLACDTLPTTGSAQAPTNGVNGRFRYVPSLKGFIYIPSWGVAYFMRTA